MGISEAPISAILQDLIDEVNIETIRGKSADFVRSVFEYHSENGFVSPAQEKSVRDIHCRHFA